ncbi:hypothetical protein Tco_1542476 [Tanacetum coccineum]
MLVIKRFSERKKNFQRLAGDVTTPATAIAVDKDEFLEVRAQLELYRSILHDHTQRLDALPPTLLEGMGWDITELYDRSATVREEIHSQCFRLGSWNVRRSMLLSLLVPYGDQYKDQREIHALRMQHAADEHEMQELRECVAALERRMDHFEE